MPSLSRLIVIAVVFVFVLAGCNSAGENVGSSEPPSESSDPAFPAGQYPMEVGTQGGSAMYRASNNEVTVRILFISPDLLVLESNGQTAAGSDITVAPTVREMTPTRRLSDLPRSTGRGALTTEFGPHRSNKRDRAGG